jgi:hypothetical protein
MEKFPLRQLQYYTVLKDFASDRGLEGSVFQKGRVIQYQKTISNLHGMIETVHFRDAHTGERLIWRTRVENLFEHWQQYMAPAGNP